MVLKWPEFRVVLYFMSCVRKTWNYVEFLTLLLVVLPLVFPSCTFHTPHHQLVVHDDTTDKSWSVTKRSIATYQLTLNMLFHTALKLSKFTSTGVGKTMTQLQQYVNKITLGFTMLLVFKICVLSQLNLFDDLSRKSRG